MQHAKFPGQRPRELDRRLKMHKNIRTEINHTSLNDRICPSVLPLPTSSNHSWMVLSGYCCCCCYCCCWCIAVLIQGRANTPRLPAEWVTDARKRWPSTRNVPRPYHNHVVGEYSILSPCRDEMSSRSHSRFRWNFQPLWPKRHNVIPTRKVNHAMM